MMKGIFFRSLRSFFLITILVFPLIDGAAEESYYEDYIAQSFYGDIKDWKAYVKWRQKWAREKDLTPNFIISSVDYKNSSLAAIKKENPELQKELDELLNYETHYYNDTKIFGNGVASNSARIMKTGPDDEGVGLNCGVSSIYGGGFYDGYSTKNYEANRILFIRSKTRGISRLDEMGFAKAPDGWWDWYKEVNGKKREGLLSVDIKLPNLPLSSFENSGILWGCVIESLGAMNPYTESFITGEVADLRLQAEAARRDYGTELEFSEEPVWGCPTYERTTPLYGYIKRIVDGEEVYESVFLGYSYTLRIDITDWILPFNTEFRDEIGAFFNVVYSVECSDQAESLIEAFKKGPVSKSDFVVCSAWDARGESFVDTQYAKAEEGEDEGVSFSAAIVEGAAAVAAAAGGAAAAAGIAGTD
ncbi:MAG: hypothetical protein J6Y13_00495, partial [Treponema sp.]|nr:hypothetical protein [Treponema sp.]